MCPGKPPQVLPASSYTVSYCSDCFLNELITISAGRALIKRYVNGCLFRVIVAGSTGVLYEIHESFLRDLFLAALPHTSGWLSRQRSRLSPGSSGTGSPTYPDSVSARRL